jgi:ferredoxin-nitrite reductase
MLEEDLLKKYSPYPGPFSRGVVACTGSEFCRYAIVETKERAVKWARFLDDQLAGEPVGAHPVPGQPSGPREDAGVIRMHFSGCSASCAQPQIADIGFRGEVAHVGNHLAEAVDIGMGGSLGTGSGFIDWIEHARPVNDVPDALLRVVRRYQSERRPDEPFYNWARRVPNDDLRRTLAEEGTGTPVVMGATKTAAPKKAPAKKAGATRAPVTKAPAAKKAAPATKAPAAKKTAPTNKKAAPR